MRGSFVHHGADRVVTAQVPPDLLFNKFGGLGTQHHARAALVGFQLVKDRLDLPALRIGQSEVGRAGDRRINNGGEQTIGLGVLTAIVDAVVDDPHHCRLRFSPFVIRWPHLGQPRSIGEGL